MTEPSVCVCMCVWVYTCECVSNKERTRKNKTKQTNMSLPVIVQTKRFPSEQSIVLLARRIDTGCEFGSNCDDSIVHGFLSTTGTSYSVEQMKDVSSHKDLRRRFTSRPNSSKNSVFWLRRQPDPLSHPKKPCWDKISSLITKSKTDFKKEGGGAPRYFVSEWTKTNWEARSTGTMLQFCNSSVIVGSDGTQLSVCSPVRAESCQQWETSTR